MSEVWDEKLDLALEFLNPRQLGLDARPSTAASGMIFRWTRRFAPN